MSTFYLTIFFNVMRIWRECYPVRAFDVAGAECTALTTYFCLLRTTTKHAKTTHSPPASLIAQHSTRILAYNQLSMYTQVRTNMHMEKNRMRLNKHPRGHKRRYLR